MTETQTMRTIIKEIFREEALTIGALAATHSVNDDFLWELCRSLDLIRIRFIRKLKPANGLDGDLQPLPKAKPHPAVQELLRRISENK
jgi:hypothetical protein